MHLRIHFKVERFFVAVLVASTAFACIADAARVRGLNGTQWQLFNGIAPHVLTGVDQTARYQNPKDSMAQ